MAINPVDGEIYVLAKISGSERFIGTLDLASSVVTFLHDLDDRYAGITFAENGNCYAITGDGATNSSTLYEINLANGDQTELIDLSSVGSDGEAIAYNTGDGKIYRYAGSNDWQTIDLSDLSTEEFTMSATPANFGHALYFEAGNNTFTLVAGGQIHSVTTSGTVSNTFGAEIGQGDGLKGIILDPAFVSVEEVSMDKFSVYPNPSNGDVTISGADDLSSITVFNLMGKKVLSLDEFQNNTVKLELSSGNYIISFESKNGQVKTEQLIID
ncbi:MAG: T9SS type A sorting domain-containing protein [Flavobacteriales bacterium]